MHYPFWYVPWLTSPMWIAIVAILHMFIVMYAVGGSILLSMQTGLAYKQNDKGYLGYLRDHTWFFVILTTVFGALTGVGIWWTIGLSSPLATEELIHVFVLIWAIEYISFILEVAAGFIFFYYWGRLDPKTHLKMGWIYAGAAFISLFAVTPITSFMIDIGSWKPGDSVAIAFFNPQAFPQIAARLGASLLLGSLYFFLHSSFRIKNDDALRTRVGRESAKWAMIGAVLMIAGGGAWYFTLPPSANAALTGASVLNVLTLVIFALSAGVVAMMYFVPIKNPSWLTPGFTLLFFGAGLAATATGEFIREAVRKPYIVYNRVLASQIRPEEIPSLKKNGYLAGGVWTSAYMRDRYPGVVVGAKSANNSSLDQSLNEENLLKLSEKARRDAGKAIFMNHCNDCHAVRGYSAVSQLARGWNRGLVYDTVIHLNRVHFFMPPWAGTDAEAQVLTDYVMSVRDPYPGGFAHSKEEK